MQEIDHETAKTEFFWKVHAYLNEYIRFADQKAGAILGIQTGILACLFISKTHVALLASKLSFDMNAFNTLLGAVSFCAFLSIFAGLGFAIAAISPRLFSEFRPSKYAKIRTQLLDGQTRGPIFWKDILNFPEAEAYFASVNALSPAVQNSNIANHIFVLAGIANSKFYCIMHSVLAGILGAIFGCLALYIQAHD